MNFISSALAQTEAPAEHPEAHAAAGIEAPAAHGEGHHTFPPFDPATFGSQLFWLVILFALTFSDYSTRSWLPVLGS